MDLRSLLKSKSELTERQQKTDFGVVRIHNEVIAGIASLAAKDVKGVLDVGTGSMGAIYALLGKKRLLEGVKVDVKESEVRIEVGIIVEYGANIPQVASAVQESVKNSVEKMTGLPLVEVDVNVQGVSLPKK